MIQRAGALPYQPSGLMGEFRSGFSFSRNVLEKVPVGEGKGEKFMEDYERMIKEMGEGASLEEVAPDLVNGLPGAAEGQKPKLDRRAQMARAREVLAAKRAKNRDKKLHGTSSMQNAAVSEPDVRQAAGAAEVRGKDGGRGVSPDGVSGVSRSGSVPGAGDGEVRAGAPAGNPAIQSQPQLTPEVIDIALRIARMPFHIHDKIFMTMPLEAAEHLLDELRRQVQALGQGLGARREQEKQDDPTKCTWCKEAFNGPYFARFPFKLESGLGQWRAIYSCRKAACLEKFQTFIENVGKQLRAERNA